MTGVRGVAEAVGDGRVLTTSLGTLPRPDATELRRRLHLIRDAFAFVKFADNPRARARVSPWAAATLALNEGVEPIVHVGCRDRNRLALQRPKFARFVDARGVSEYVERVRRHATVVDDPPDRPTVTRDPKDDYLVALARQQRAEAIVSGDRDLLDARLGTPSVWTPPEMVDRLAGG